MVERANTKQIDPFASFVCQTADNLTIYITHIFHLVVKFNFAQVFPTANHSLKSLYLVNVEFGRRLPKVTEDVCNLLHLRSLFLVLITPR